MGITLYLGTKNLSSWSLRPYLALAHTGVKFDEVVLPLAGHPTPELTMVSPSGQVPVLVHDAESGEPELRIWESLAICEYLAETFPNAALWPKDRAARAFARSVSNEMHGGFPNLRAELPMHCAQKLPAPNLSDAAKRQVSRVRGIWRECRERFGAGGPFLFGAFSIADAMYAPVCTRFRTYGIELDRVSNEYCDAVFALPAMKSWLAASEAEVAAAKAK